MSDATRKAIAERQDRKAKAQEPVKRSKKAEEPKSGADGQAAT